MQRARHPQRLTQPAPSTRCQGRGAAGRGRSGAGGSRRRCGNCGRWRGDCCVVAAGLAASGLLVMQACTVLPLKKLYQFQHLTQIKHIKHLVYNSTLHLDSNVQFDHRLSLFTKHFLSGCKGECPAHLGGLPHRTMQQHLHGRSNSCMSKCSRSSGADVVCQWSGQGDGTTGRGGGRGEWRERATQPAASHKTKHNVERGSKQSAGASASKESAARGARQLADESEGQPCRSSPTPCVVCDGGTALNFR